jgi:hypothetical protein
MRRRADNPRSRAYLTCRRLACASVDLLHHLELQVPLGHHLLQPGTLLLKATYMLDVSRFELGEALSPALDRRYRNPMPPGDLSHRGLVRFAQDLNHLFFFESVLLHGSSLHGKGHLL